MGKVMYTPFNPKFSCVVTAQMIKHRANFIRLKYAPLQLKPLSIFCIIVFGFSNRANHKPTSAAAEALAKNMIALISLCEAGLGLCSSQQEISVPMKWLG